MFNWNVDEDRFRKEDLEGYKLWRLTQLVNYGCDKGERINKKELKQNWNKIKENLDPYKRRLMEYLIWGKLYLLPVNINFWDMHKLTEKYPNGSI